MAEVVTCQNAERNRPSEANSLPGDDRGSGLSGQQKRLTERCALTLWRHQKKQFVRTPKEIDRVMHTHVLETGEGATC